MRSLASARLSIPWQLREGGEDGRNNLPQPRITPHLVLGLLVTFNLAVGVPQCGTGGVRVKRSGVTVGCGCHVCVCGCDNVAICSVCCMCTSLLGLHNSLPAGTCGSSSQGTKLLYSSTQPPHNQKASTQTHTQTHTTVCKRQESSSSNQSPHKNSSVFEM